MKISVKQSDMQNQTEFCISVRASALSTLSREELERRLVLALWDEESDRTTPDGQTDKFEVLDYKFTVAEEIKD